MHACRPIAGIPGEPACGYRFVHLNVNIRELERAATMLTPMQVQYVVGLCCLRRNPDTVDITVGDLVQDAAAEEPRDVDITVTLHEADGTLRAFKAYEVKRKGKPLDVASVEQLCVKLKNMPAVTHRAIVSASGYTRGAIAKANAHNVTLYVLKPWTKPLAEQLSEFPNVGRPEEFFLRGFTSNLLYWVNWGLFLVVPDGPPSFTTPTFASDGSPHKSFATIKEFQDALLMKSTEILFDLETARTILRTFPVFVIVENDSFESTPPWPHTHTLDVREYKVFLKLDTGLAAVTSVTISGSLQWRRRARAPEFHVVERLPSGEIFAAAAVADYGVGDGRMFAMIFPPDSRTVSIHLFQLLEKHKNAIRKLKIPVSTAQPS